MMRVHAIALLLGLVSLSPNVLADSLSNGLAEARGLVVSGAYAQAATRLDALQRIHRTNPAIRLLRLEVAERTGDEQAVEEQVGFFFYLYNSDAVSTNAAALTAVAWAVRNEDPHGAWRAFQQAQKADPTHVDAFVRAGHHCIERFAWPLAKRQFDQAMRLAPSNTAVLAGRAQIAMMMNRYEEAHDLLDRAIALDPEAADPRLLKAAVLAVDEAHAEARSHIDAVLAINPRHAEALGLLAASHEHDNDAAARDAAIQRALAVNPKDGDVYNVLAQASERRRRFPQAVQWARKAIQTNPDDFQGYFHAGMNLLRLGEEREGYDLLDQAFRRNSFNVWAYNMLTVLDRDFKRGEFVQRETPHFVIKIDRKEDAIIGPYLAPLAEQAWSNLVARYDFTPVGPETYGGKLLVLVFPTHEEFSARTVGLPGMGAAGACFGQVITLPSPRVTGRDPKRRMHWAHIFEHELAHVVTLQMTNYRIPRWLTEGISTWEERDPQISMDAVLARAVREDRLLPLNEINRGFSRPAFPGQVPLSYYHASLVCEHLVQAHGFDALITTLEGVRDGLRDTAALEHATGLPLSALQSNSMAHVRAHVRDFPVSANPIPIRIAALADKRGADEASDDALLARAGVLMAQKKWAAVQELALQLTHRSPKDWRAHWVLGRVAQDGDQDPEAACVHFAEAARLAPDAAAAHLHLGLAQEAAGNNRAALIAYDRAAALHPRLPAWEDHPLRRAALLLQSGGDSAAAAEKLRQMVATHRHLAPAQLLLGDLLQEMGREDEAADHYLEAVWMNPYSRVAHEKALPALEKAGRKAEAARERAVLAALAPARRNPDP